MPLEPLETWRHRGATVSVLGRKLFRVAAGTSGIPIVLVHGFPTSSYDFSAMLPLLGTRRVLGIDLLGYGLSEKPWPHDYRIDEQADLVEAWLAAEGVKRAHILAHDMGDTVVQEILARRLEGKPGLEPVSIVLMNGGIIVEKIQPILAQRVLRRPLLGRIVSLFIGRRAFGRSLKGIANPARLPSEDELDALWKLIEWNEGNRVSPGLIQYMNERVSRRDRWRRATLEHPFPMRLVWGDSDPISPFSMPEEVKALRPSTDVVRLERTGHYPQVEEPEACARAALDWFSRHEVVESST